MFHEEQSKELPLNEQQIVVQNLNTVVTERTSRVLVRNEQEQKNLELNSAAQSTLKAARTYIKSFLFFSNAPEDSAITREQLTDQNCTHYISAI